MKLYEIHSFNLTFFLIFLQKLSNLVLMKNGLVKYVSKTLSAYVLS